MGRRTYGTVWNDNGRWKIAFYLGGKRYKRVGGRNKTVSAKKLAKIERLKDDGLSPEEILHEVFGDRLASSESFAQWAERYMERPGVEGRDAETAMKENSRIKRVGQAPWASKPIKAIKRKQIKEWHERRAKETSGPNANRGLTIASVIFKYAIEHEAVLSNPCEGVKRYSEEGRERGVYLEPDECMALLDSCEDWFRPIVVVALNTGMRRGEILELQWKQIDFLRGRIQARLRETKTKKKRLVGINTHARAALMQMRDLVDAETSKPTDRVFPFTSWQMRKEWEATLARCTGIPEDKKEETVFHTLRHTFASLAVQNGMSLEELMKILGHRVFKTVLRYAKFKPDVGVAPVSRLDDVFRRDDGRDPYGAALGQAR